LSIAVHHPRNLRRTSPQSLSTVLARAAQRYLDSSALLRLELFVIHCHKMLMLRDVHHASRKCLGDFERGAAKWQYAGSFSGSTGTCKHSTSGLPPLRHSRRATKSSESVPDLHAFAWQGRIINGSIMVQFVADRKPTQEDHSEAFSAMPVILRSHNLPKAVSACTYMFLVQECGNPVRWNAELCFAASLQSVFSCYATA
jgi:hypothetical protein